MAGEGQQPSLFKVESEKEQTERLPLIWRYLREASGLFLFALSLITLFAIFGFSEGSWLTPWVLLWRRLLGWGAALVVLGLAFAGYQLIAHRRSANLQTWTRVIAFELAAFGFLGILNALGGHSLERAELGLDGGLVGWGLLESLKLIIGIVLPDWFAQALGVLLLASLFLISALYALALLGNHNIIGRLRQASELDSDPVLMHSGFPGEPEHEAEKIGKRKRSRLPEEFRKNLSADEDSGKGISSSLRQADLPPLDLLIPETAMKLDERHINQMAGLLEKTLSEFGIPAKVVGYKVGPTVTQFALEPGYIGKGDDVQQQKIRVSQISALQKDLALALSAQRLRIQAPVPGRSYVGLEIPNIKAHTVRLRAILESKAFQNLNSSLGIALGRDVSGHPIAADLAKMPHILIAGTTGSGKSVLISAIISCLAMNNDPEELKLIMLDPKMVELSRFNGLPHLYGKVETKLDRINTVLRWVVAEMQRRYKMLEQERVRDLENYNRKISGSSKGKKMPRIVVLIDELADLMMSAAEHTESALVRLAQMARATGIHLIVATQRPSTDVVTGLIKANFPARISFAVASAIDSRVILDYGGAESLLGRGDMLYLSPEAAAPLRSQGVMVEDQEIDAIISYWKSEGKSTISDDNQTAQSEIQAPWDEMIRNDAVLTDRDEMIEDAISEIRATGKSSASHLQRALRIGYPRAARLVDQLEEMGILGPLRSGGKDREILISLNDEG